MHSSCFAAPLSRSRYVSGHQCRRSCSTDRFQLDGIAAHYSGFQARTLMPRCAAGRRCRRSNDRGKNRNGTIIGHECRGAGRQSPNIVQPVHDLLQLGCRPERTSQTAGLAGSAGPATASPTFFPGLVPSPSSRGKKLGFGRPPLCCGLAGAGPSSARLIDRLSRPHRAASHH